MEAQQLIGGCDIIFLIETSEIMGELQCYDVRLRLFLVQRLFPTQQNLQAFNISKQIVSGIYNITNDNNHVGLAHYSSPDWRTAVSLQLSMGTNPDVSVVDDAQDYHSLTLGCKCSYQHCAQRDPVLSWHIRHESVCDVVGDAVKW